MPIDSIFAIGTLIISVVLMFRRKENFLYILPIILICYDTLFLKTYVSQYSFHDSASALVMIFFLYLWVTKKIKTFKINIWIIILAAYFALKILDSDNIIRSLLSYNTIIGSMLMFYVGYNHITSLENLSILNKSMVMVMIIFIINFAVSNAFQLGDDPYALGIWGGNLTREHSFIVSLGVCVTPLIIRYNKINRIFILVLSVLCFLVLLLLLRRTAILLAISGILMEVLFQIKYAQNMKGWISTAYALVFFALISLLLYPGATDKYQELLRMRGFFITESMSDQLENEARTRELRMVFAINMETDVQKTRFLG